MKPKQSRDPILILRLPCEYWSGFDIFCPTKGTLLLILPLTCGLSYIKTLWLDVYVSSYPFRCITLFGLDNMLDIPQQNHLKYDFGGIKVNTYLKIYKQKF